MNNKPCWEVECIYNTSAYSHQDDLANSLNDGWEIITDGVIYDPTNVQMFWYATARRQVKPSRIADTDFERSLMELEDDDPLNERVRREAGDLLTADDPFKRAEIANQIVENAQVGSMVLMLLAESVIPVIPEYKYQKVDVLQ